MSTNLKAVFCKFCAYGNEIFCRNLKLRRIKKAGKNYAFVPKFD